MSKHLGIPPGVAVLADGIGSLPMLLVAGGILVPVLLFLFVWWRYRSTRRRVAGRFEEFKEHVIEMRQRVEATRERHKQLTVRDRDYTQPMQGTTLAVYNAVDAEMTRLWDGWLQRMDAWDKAQALIASEGFLRVGRLREADRLLDQLGRFEAVDRSVRECVEHLDRLENGHERARALHAEQQQRPESLRPQIASVGSLGLDTVAYETELAKCVALIGESAGLITADPLGGLATLEEARDKMTALEGWMKDVTHQFHQAGAVRGQLEEAAARVSACRSRGLRLVEPEADPGPMLDRGREEHARALQALQKADAKTAGRHVDAALEQVKNVGEAIERQERSKAECAREVPARRTAADRLRQETVRAGSLRAELERAFASESWQAVADNLDRSRQLKTAADTGLDEAASASADAVQHYFRAVSLLGQVRTQQEQAGELLAAIERRLGELTALREESLRRRQELTDLDRQTQGYLASHGSVVGRSARSRYEAAAERGRQVRMQTESLRPNWVTVKQQLDEARTGYTAARKEAEEDVAAHQKLLARFDVVVRDAAGVEQLLEGHHEDRARANACYRTAREGLDRVRAQIAPGGLSGTGTGAADWARLLQQLEGLADELRKAEALAREDIRLADQAQAEITAASQAVVRAGEYFTADRPAEMAQAETLFTQATQHLIAQEYEQAIEKASAARRSATRAVEDANRAAEQERQRLAEAAAIASAFPPPTESNESNPAN